MKLQIIKIMFLIAVLLGAGAGIYWIIQDSRQEEQSNIGFITFEDRGIIFDLVLDGDVLYAAAQEGILSFDTTAAVENGMLEGSENISYARAILLDDNGQLWIGHDMGISIYDPATGETSVINEQKGLLDNRVTSLSKGDNGTIWAGTWGGAVCVDGDGVPAESLTRSEGLLDDMVSEIYFDEKGGLWCGSAVSPGGGLSCLYKGNWRYYTIDNQLPHNSINDIYLLSDSQILVGTGFYDKGGVARFNYSNDDWRFEKNYSIQDGVLAGKIRSIYSDDSGILWIGYEFEGISLFKGGKSLILTTEDGLPHNEVMKVLQDRQGNYWLATADGTAYIEKDDLLSYFDRNNK